MNFYFFALVEIYRYGNRTTIYNKFEQNLFSATARETKMNNNMSPLMNRVETLPLDTIKEVLYGLPVFDVINIYLW
jgi:hypothetical protein